MRLFLGKYRGDVVLVLTILSIVGSTLFYTACSDTTPPPILPPDDPPKITLFSIEKTVLTEHDTISISFGATDDVGIDSAIIDYGEPNGIRYKRTNSGKHLSGFVTRQYGIAGFFMNSFAVYDTRGQVARESILVMVFPDSSIAPSSQVRFGPK